ncbi:MAG: M28 family peptidase, partial [Bacteroidales bacterium]|nr:M28 family peptidase [Bacteroidales bacterium]
LQTEKLNLKLKNFEWSPVTATDTEGFAKRQVPTLAISTGLKSPYHKPEDDADLIDYEGLDKVTDYLTDLTFEVASDENLAASGRVAGKHRSGVPILEAGLSLAVGNSHFNYPKAAFDGKAGFSYGGGVTAQLNFGHHSHFGIKADALFVQATAPYPDEADIFGSSLKYKGSELLVPVQLVLHGSGKGPGFLGAGAYYGHKFKTSLPVERTVNTEDYGLSFEFGLQSGNIGMSVTWLSSLKPFFAEENAPSVRQGAGLFRLTRYF